MRRKPGGLVPLEAAICITAAKLQRDATTEFHGYQIARLLGDASERRLLTAYGTLYRALGRLENMDCCGADGKTPTFRLVKIGPAGVYTP
jgi:hypothetical protein